MAEKIINGIDVGELGKTIHQFRQKPELGNFEFRVRNKWHERGYSETTIAELYGAGEERDGRHFVLSADEPEILLGKDKGPNPVEHLLNALATCLTGAMVYHAAGRGIRIEECECELKGKIDIRGFLGVSPDVRKGYQHIQVRFRVKSDAPAEQLEECARFSPVFDVVTHGTEVSLEVEKTGEPTYERPGAEAEAPGAQPG